MDYSTMQDVHRIQIGEVFQLHTKEVILACSHCSEEFESFTEFSLHAQEHLQQLWQQSSVILEDICANDGFKTESVPDKSMDQQYSTVETDSNDGNTIFIKCETIEDNESEFSLHAQEELWQQHTVQSEYPTFTTDELIEITPSEPIDQQSASVEEAAIAETSSIWKKSEIIDEDNRTDNIVMDFWSEEQIKSEAIEQQVLDQRQQNGAKSKNAQKLHDARYVQLIMKHQASTSNAHGLRTLDEFRRRVRPMKVADTPETRMMADMFIYTWKGSTSDAVCPICEKSFASTTCVRYHIFNHCKTPILQCPFCTKTTNEMGRYRAHLRKHTNYRFQCYICKISLENLLALQIHMNCKHTGTDELIDDGRYDELIAEYNASAPKAHIFRMLKKFRTQMSPMKISDTPETRMMAHLFNIRKEHAKSDVDGRRKVCPICNEPFFKMRNHMFIHCKASMFQCPWCNKACRRPTKVTEHLRTHTKHGIECYLCKDQFQQYHELKYHIRREHTGFTYCNICKLQFERSQQLKMHMEKLHPRMQPAFEWMHFGIEKPISRSWECHLCRKTFKFRRGIVRHMKFHSNSPVYCPDCGEQYNSQSSLKQHLRRHNGERSYACALCNRAFNDRDDLASHRKNVHNLNASASFECPICHKKLRRSLKKHLRRHNSERSYACTLCNKAFNVRDDLASHRRNVHNLNASASFECPICHKKLRRLSAKNHMKLHTDKPKFKCTVCDKTFRTRHNLGLHSVTHDKANAPVYKCEICDKTYYVRSKCQKHRRTHAEPMPFHCKHCNLGFFLAESQRRCEMRCGRRKEENQSNI